MVAVRPTFHLPALLAKQAANIDHISGGRLSLNVVSSWWADEARMYGVDFEQHDQRYARTAEWLEVLDGVWSGDRFSYSGRFYRVDGNVLQPKPLARPRPVLYAGGESEAAKELIARRCDAYLMHGDPPERVAAKVADMTARRERLGLPPLRFGVAGYVVVRDSESAARAELARITDVQQSAAGFANFQQWLAGTQLEQKLSIEDYSVSNRGLRAGLVSTPAQLQEQVGRFEEGPESTCCSCNSARSTKRWRGSPRPSSGPSAGAPPRSRQRRQRASAWRQRWRRQARPPRRRQARRAARGG